MSRATWIAINGTWKDDLPLAVASISFSTISILIITLEFVLLCIYYDEERHHWFVRKGLHLCKWTTWIVSFTLFIIYFTMGNVTEKLNVENPCLGVEIQGCNMSSRVVLMFSFFVVFLVMWIGMSCCLFCNNIDLEDPSTTDVIRNLPHEYGLVRKPAGYSKLSSKKEDDDLDDGTNSAHFEDIDKVFNLAVSLEEKELQRKTNNPRARLTAIQKGEIHKRVMSTHNV